MIWIALALFALIVLIDWWEDQPSRGRAQRGGTVHHARWRND